MTHTKHGATPKPHPRTSAVEGASGDHRHWRDVANHLAAEMHPHLNKRRAAVRLRAASTVRNAIINAGLVPIGGDIDVSQAEKVADVALGALSSKGLLSPRALNLLETR